MRSIMIPSHPTISFAGLNSHDEDYKMSTLRSYLSDTTLQLLESFGLPPYQVT